MVGKYIYGIINSEGQRYFECCELAKFEIEVIYSVPHEDISAVISDSEIVDYTRLQKDVLARQLVKQQKIAEGLMSRGYTIIPMRLGTFAENTDDVRRILNESYPVAKEILGKIKGLVEIDVAVTWNDFNSLIKKIGDEPDIKEFKTKFSEKNRQVTIDDQMKVGLMIKKSLDKRSAEYADSIQREIGAISRNFKTHELMDDKMVTNTAYLIEKARQKEFEETIERLNTKFDGKLDFRCVGPLPPYSFYTLEIKRWRFDQIDWARKKLGLQDSSATLEEIKKAHQSMARLLHPDKRPNTFGAEKDFDELTRAYKMLCEYCRDEKCFFTEAEMEKNAVLVKIKE